MWAATYQLENGETVVVSGDWSVHERYRNHELISGSRPPQAAPPEPPAKPEPVVAGAATAEAKPKPKRSGSSKTSAAEAKDEPAPDPEPEPETVEEAPAAVTEAADES